MQLGQWCILFLRVFPEKTRIGFDGAQDLLIEKGAGVNCVSKSLSGRIAHRGKACRKAVFIAHVSLEVCGEALALTRSLALPG